MLLCKKHIHAASLIHFDKINWPKLNKCTSTSYKVHLKKSLISVILHTLPVSPGAGCRVTDEGEPGGN